jgi:hypothetical protein
MFGRGKDGAVVRNRAVRPAGDLPSFPQVDAYITILAVFRRGPVRPGRDQFRPCYTAVAVASKKAESVAAWLALEAVKSLVAAADRLTLALDDTPAKR